MVLNSDAIGAIVKDFKRIRKIEEALDGDEVEELTEIVKAHLNYNEGNITVKEFHDKLAEFGI